MNYDVFNGDADGICALLQLRLAEPRESTLITGVKRDISLLKRVDAVAGDKVTVLDVSLEKNRQPLIDLLGKDVDVFYVDHHQAGEIPDSPKLECLINTDADICTSLLIDQYLHHRFSEWAVTAAFGDNLEQSARRAAQPLNLTDGQLQQLRQLGNCINYNAYGESIEDLHFAPATLFESLQGYRSPFGFISGRQDVFQALVDGYASDMVRVFRVLPEHRTDKVAVFILPDQKWARRVSGAWSNELANQNPDRAHAVLTHNMQGGFLVSVRAPLNSKAGADVLCGQFPGGGGRKAAAGIDHLPMNQLSAFMLAFDRHYR